MSNKCPSSGVPPLRCELCPTSIDILEGWATKFENADFVALNVDSLELASSQLIKHKWGVARVHHVHVPQEAKNTFEYQQYAGTTVFSTVFIKFIRYFPHVHQIQ